SRQGGRKGAAVGKNNHATIRSGADNSPSSRMFPGKGVDSGNPRVQALLAPKVRAREVRFMDYAKAFLNALQAVKDEGRYRIFADIRRNRGRFPSARHFAGAGARQITVWCSNDYLGMGQHPAVLAAMHEALDTAGAGSGGTRNISGTSHYHVELEAELADLHRKEAALLFTSAYVANDTTLATLQKLLAGCVVFSDEK